MNFFLKSNGNQDITKGISWLAIHIIYEREQTFKFTEHLLCVIGLYYQYGIIKSIFGLCFWFLAQSS